MGKGRGGRCGGKEAGLVRQIERGGDSKCVFHHNLFRAGRGRERKHGPYGPA